MIKLLLFPKMKRTRARSRAAEEVERTPEQPEQPPRPIEPGTRELFDRLTNLCE